MKKQRILSVFLLLIVVCGIVLWKDNKREVKIEAAEQEYVPENDYCSMEDLGEMDYDLFCYTEMSSDVGPVESDSVIINNQTQTVEEAMELCQEFKGKLALEKAEENEENDDERTELVYVSPDCKWAITNRWNKFQTVSTMTLFYDHEKNKEKVFEGSTDTNIPIVLVKDGDAYKEMGKDQYEELSEIVWLDFYGSRYANLKRINAEGKLVVEANNDFSLLTIRRAEDGTDQWSYDLEGIKEETREIRESKGYEEDSVVGVFIEQFEGNEQEGWLVVQAGPSSFFRIAYPSGEVTYLGEYLYSPCFSPDGKYLAYSGIDYDNVVGMDLEEEKKIPPFGIYIREMETGKTAYIDWDRLPENRSFVWLKKESFEEYMTDTGRNK